MSERARRRRARAAALPADTRAARPGLGSGLGKGLRLPLLPMLAAALGLALLALAWTTRWTPGPPREALDTTGFTLEIPAEQQRVINSWERFFICHDLLDPAVVDLTLRANQRATGSLDFPVDKVLVELPSPTRAANAERAASGAEDELIAVRSSVLNAAVPERLALVRRQCGGGT